MMPIGNTMKQEANYIILPKKMCVIILKNTLIGSYISLIDEELFLANPEIYIENAYDKSRDINNYNITKQR